jgi:oligoendopeptidase F
MARYFFASPEAEKRARAKLLQELTDLEAAKGRLLASPASLLAALQAYDRVLVDSYRHRAYFRLRYALNTADRDSSRQQAALGSEVGKRVAFLERELQEAGDEKIDVLLRQEPRLKAYRHAIESLRLGREHVLPLGEEELLRSLGPALTGWQYELYQDLITRTRFGTVHTADGELDCQKKRTLIAESPDAAVREAGFRKRFAGFASQRDLYAFVLLHMASALDRRAQLRHFDDAAAEVYFRSEWQTPDVDHVLAEVARHADIYKRYERLRANHLKKVLGLSNIHYWDLAARPPEFQAPRFSVAEASQTIRAAVAPLGPDFSREMALLLDPGNGRIDIAPSENRYSGGFSLGFTGTTSVFFGGVFQGRYNDMRVMAHEATHAVHRQLMSSNQVLPPLANGPSYLFESFAVFSELLLADHLHRQATEPSRKQYFLEQFLDGKGTIMFVAGPEAELEQAVYQGATRGDIKDANDLDALTRRVYSRYSIWPERTDELKERWMMIPLMYEDPFYDVNYVYAGLLGLKYLEMYTSNREDFVPRYIALMKNGFDAPASALLKQFLGIDLNSPAFVRDAMTSVDARVQALARSYDEHR